MGSGLVALLASQLSSLAVSWLLRGDAVRNARSGRITRQKAALTTGVALLLRCYSVVKAHVFDWNKTAIHSVVCALSINILATHLVARHCPVDVAVPMGRRRRL